MPPLGSDNPRRPLEVDDRLRGEDRRRRAGHRRTTATSRNGRMFPIDRGVHRQADRPRVCRDARAVGAALRGRRRSRATARRIPSCRPNDEFANFERWDKGNLDLSEPKKPEMLQYEYARSALKNGLKLEQELGVNPYKFGMIGRTDAHTGLATAEEDNFFGKTSAMEPSAERVQPCLRQDAEDRRHDHGLGDDGVRLCRGLGDREHARGDLRRDEAPRDLRHHRPAHDRALLRRLGLRRRPTPTTRMPGRGRLRQGRADGRRSRRGARGQGADLPRRRAQGPDRRQSRSHPDHQGLAGHEGQGAGEGLRRRLVGRPQARTRTASCRRSATPSTSPTRPGPTRSALRS